MSKSSNVVIRWRKRTKRKMVMAMGNRCQICDYDKCDDALEFHHIDPLQKDISFRTLRSNPRRMELIIAELKKCVLLCSNCHKEVHRGITLLPENFANLDESFLLSEIEINKKLKQQKGIRENVPDDRRKIFLSKEELKELLQTEFKGNKSALSRYLKVSETAIRKHLV